MWESRWPPDYKNEEQMQNRCKCSGFDIDTDIDEQQLIDVNPISRVVLLDITGFTSDQRAEERKFRVLMADKTSVRE